MHILDYWALVQPKLSECSEKIWHDVVGLKGQVDFLFIATNKNLSHLKEDQPNARKNYGRILNANGGIGQCEQEEILHTDKKLRILIDGSESIDNFNEQLAWTELLVRGALGSGVFDIGIFNIVYEIYLFI